MLFRHMKFLWPPAPIVNLRASATPFKPRRPYQWRRHEELVDSSKSRHGSNLESDWIAIISPTTYKLMTIVNALRRPCGMIFKPFHSVNSSDGCCSPEYSDRTMFCRLPIIFGFVFLGVRMAFESQPFIVEFRVKVKLGSCCHLCIGMTGIYLCNVIFVSNRIIWFGRPTLWGEDDCWGS